MELVSKSGCLGRDIRAKASAFCDSDRSSPFTGVEVFPAPSGPPLAPVFDVRRLLKKWARTPWLS